MTEVVKEQKKDSHVENTGMSLQDAIAQFKKAKHIIPVETINLKMYGDNVKWSVRMLTSVQLGIINRAVDQARKLENLISIMESATTSSIYFGEWSETIQKLKAELGIDENVDPETVRQYATFEQGSIACDKDWSRADTVKYARYFTANFVAVYVKINEMLDKGPGVKKKPVNSGKIQK